LVDAFTIKPNGKIIDLNSKEVELNIYNNPDAKNSRWKQLRFSIPGVEVGDEIEIIYKTRLPYLRTSDDLYFHSNLQILNSVITIDIPEPLGVKLNVYNNLGQPKVIEGGHHITYQWRLKNLKSIGMQNYSIPAMELPYIAYNVNFKLMFKWDNLYNAYYNSYKQVDYAGKPKSMYFGNFLRKQQQDYPDSQPTDLFYNVMMFIQDSMQVVNLSEEEANNPLGYFLFERKINNKNLHILIREVLDFYNIPFETCFGRDKYDGPIDFDFPSTHQINEIFYLFNDANGSPRIVYPSYPNHRYYFDELPNNLEGTQVLAVKGRNQYSVKIQTRRLKIPVSVINNNYLKQYKTFTINLNEKKFDIECKEKYSGNFLRDERQEKLSMNDDFDPDLLNSIYGFKPDTFYVDEFTNTTPIKYSVRYNYSEEGLFDIIESDLYSFQLSNFVFHHSIIDYPDIERTMSFYPEMAYEDQVNIFLSFEEPVSIKNESSLDKYIENEFGSYSLLFKQVSNNSIQIVSQYKIYGKPLPAKNYNLLLELNKFLDQAMELEVFVGKD
jgi:hypothetical protein